MTTSPATSTAASSLRHELARPSRRLGWLTAVIVLVVVGALVVAAAVVPGVDSRVAASTPLTHTVARDDLLVTVTEQGTLESANNTEIKCRVRGDNTIIWVVENGAEVEAGDELLRLDTLLIEEEISERTKYAHLARAEATPRESGCGSSGNRHL